MNYQRIYDQIIDRARNRELQGYSERHHIVPKCMGGSNQKENLVRLKAREHFICHQLLVFIHPTNKQVAYAFWGMCNQLGSKNNKRDYKISARTYETGREFFIQAIKGRKCTWGGKISDTKKGVSQGKRTVESITKQKATIANSPYKHSKQAKQLISQKLTKYKKTEIHKQAISATIKSKGIRPPSQAKQVEIEGKIYPSIKVACEQLGQPRHRVNKIIKKVGNS
jgi:hypothetical protein